MVSGKAGAVHGAVDLGCFSRARKPELNFYIGSKQVTVHVEMGNYLETVL